MKEIEREQGTMRDCRVLCLFIALVLVFVHGVNGEDPYRFITWKVTYGDIYPLGVKQQVTPHCVHFSVSFVSATLFLCLTGVWKMLFLLVVLLVSL